MIPEIRFESEQNGVAWKADDGHVGLEFVDRVRRELDEVIYRIETTINQLVEE